MGTRKGNACRESRSAGAALLARLRASHHWRCLLGSEGPFLCESCLLTSRLRTGECQPGRRSCPPPPIFRGLPGGFELGTPIFFVFLAAPTESPYEMKILLALSTQPPLHSVSSPREPAPTPVSMCAWTKCRCLLGTSRDPSGEVGPGLQAAARAGA